VHALFGTSSRDQITLISSRAMVKASLNEHVDAAGRAQSRQIASLQY
jgi:hypothetical protein